MTLLIKLKPEKQEAINQAMKILENAGFKVRSARIDITFNINDEIDQYSDFQLQTKKNFNITLRIAIPDTFMNYIEGSDEME